jgi:NAD(P)-dependent dehydrogenase (short-subunit alcohol dehydrogenase family)
MFDFDGKVAMITGASGNLGRVIARAFYDSGASLAIIDRHEDVLRKIFPDLVGSLDCYLSGCADITDLGEVGKVVEAAADFFGHIDILVNTVGGYRAGQPLHETPLSTFEFMFKLNAQTTFVINRCVIPHMIRQGGGKIINLAARPGLSGRANMAAYSASKAAVLRLTESASAELKNQGINVNCLLPGTIDTPQNRAAMPDADPSRWVTPESLANVILFMTSDAAKDIHGAAVPVYGLT